MNVPVIVAAPQDNHRPLEWSIEVESEASGKQTAPWGALSPQGGSSAVGGDLSVRDGHEAFDIGAAVALPDIARPKSVKALNSALEARLARQRGHRDDPQGQTQASDPPDRVGNLICHLKGLKAPASTFTTRLCLVVRLFSCAPSKRPRGQHGMISVSQSLLEPGLFTLLVKAGPVRAVGLERVVRCYRKHCYDERQSATKGTRLRRRIPIL
jgi:hypothetical protein